jgi:Ca-activated chloride channel family protein
MRFLPILILLLFLVPIARAQQPAVSPTPLTENEDCGLTTPELVTLNVSVWSKNKGYLKDLTHKNFEIFDGKDKQTIEYFSQTDEPASIGILFDLSESVQNLRNSRLNEVALAVEGLRTFINAANSKNEYFIVAFANETKVLLDPTQDKNEIESALKTLAEVKPKNGTSFFDAVDQGFAKISGGKFDKKILLVVSDAADTNSKTLFSSIKKQSRQNPGVLLYQIDIMTENTDTGSLYEMQSAAFFQELAGDSGGRVFSPTNREEIREAFESLAEELKSQYKIGFSPADSDATKKDWRSIKINLNLPAEKKAESGKISVRARKGFYF